MKVEERFLKYVAFDTESDQHSTLTPSTLKQLELGKYLVKELHELGVANAHQDEYGIVYATLASNIDKEVPKLGFLAHMDTSPDLTGANIKPRVIENYDGKDIVLNEELNIVTEVEMFPFLKNKVGETLIVTDGTTLLGADDKAGIAQIMNVIEEIINNDLPHGELRFAFTCDEEVGRGTDCFDIPKFDADYAYTIDGGSVGSVDYETFNAASAHLVFHGSSIHPGSAKNKMINALHLAMQFHSMLPAFKDPANTELYEGFNHLVELNGSCEEATAYYIIRDHSIEQFNKAKVEFQKIADYLNDFYGHEVCTLTVTDSYYNMGEIIKNDMFTIDLAKKAYQELNIPTYSSPIRGGTDGARLTYDGLICPNLGTGGYNFHGKYELVSVDEMNLGVKAILKMIELNNQ